MRRVGSLLNYSVFADYSKPNGASCECPAASTLGVRTMAPTKLIHLSLNVINTNGVIESAATLQSCGPSGGQRAVGLLLHLQRGA